MVHYKLHYFDLYGRAEPTRMMFVLADVEFEDRRFSFDEWTTLKTEPTFVFGQAPILEVDGKRLAQSIAIHRYVGNKLGFAGKTDWDRALVDSIADTLGDHFQKVADYYKVSAGFMKGDKEALFKSSVVPARDEFLGQLTKFIDQNESQSGFLVGDSVTFADLLLLNHVMVFDNFQKGFTDGFPKIEALCNKIKEMPRMKEYLATRPHRNI